MLSNLALLMKLSQIPKLKNKFILPTKISSRFSLEYEENSSDVLKLLRATLNIIK